MRSILAIAVIIPIMVLAQLSFGWSFTETTFGGYLGFALPPGLGLSCFLLGRLYQSAEPSVRPLKPRKSRIHGAPLPIRKTASVPAVRPLRSEYDAYLAFQR